MPTVYTAASPLDAQLVVDLLEDAGVDASLSSPGPAGQVEVLVETADADAARALVRHLESGTPELGDADDADEEISFEAIALPDDDEDLLLDSTALGED